MSAATKRPVEIPVDRLEALAFKYGAPITLPPPIKGGWARATVQGVAYIAWLAPVGLPDA
ncbi:hypothetical protein [Nocardioides alcanivorans]|uniref:hypothetical protein n=1 Tax=Nocardioides alcanivorans TaxID=2897352 RepID=UPI001F41FCC6|nr:hypothetical protein [Nocardioides alcanivorans]